MLLVPAGNASQWTGPTGNNTYVLRGRTPALIDAGVGSPAHVSAVGAALAGADLAVVLITHGHPDHMKGIPALIARWPRADVRQFSADGREDGQTIAAGDTALVALHTPGHAPDHFCFLDRDSHDLYCGDLARRGGTIVIPASAGGSLKAYLASLQRIRALKPRRLLPGHGPIVDDPTSLIDEYLAHRESRERQIVEALADGPSTPEDLVRRVYRALPDGLARAAADSVRAHLVKLEEEGRAAESDGTWRTT